ncbi:hypothetical protein SPHINGOR109_50842 [Sphingorhabdus sp. 109]|nr:hypothetical protein SPHINGOR109_50842 [Sphingorhabdus sp. 109]
MIDAGDAVVRQALRKQGPEAALHAIAGDGIADLLGHRNPVTEAVRLNRMIRATAMR